MQVGSGHVSDSDASEAFCAKCASERTFPTTAIKAAIRGAPLLLNAALFLHSGSLRRYSEPRGEVMQQQKGKRKQREGGGGWKHTNEV